MKLYCLVCNHEFDLDGLEKCPHCGSVGDDLAFDLETIEEVYDAAEAGGLYDQILEHAEKAHKARLMSR